MIQFCLEVISKEVPCLYSEGEFFTTKFHCMKNFSLVLNLRQKRILTCHKFSLLRGGLFVLWGGWGERKRERTNHVFSLFPSCTALSIFFDYCYFYRDTQREPLRRRESQDSFKGILIYPFNKTGHPTSIFGKYLIGRQFEIQNIRSICCMKNFLLAFLS